MKKARNENNYVCGHCGYECPCGEPQDTSSDEQTEAKE